MAEELDTETAAEVAELESKLKALRGMVAAGVLIAMHGGTSLQYRSVADLLKAIRYLKGEVRRLKGESRSPSYVVQNTKGY